MNYSDLKALGSDLVGLTLNGSPRWRLLVLGAILTLLSAIVWGYFNYARASDVQGLKGEVTDIKVQLLSQSILAACKEKHESQQEGEYSTYWQEHLSKLKREYWEMTGQTFELPPSC